YGVTEPITTNTTTSSTYPNGSPGPVITNWNASGKKITGFTHPTFTYTSTSYATNWFTNVTYYDYILDDGNWELSSLNGSVYVKGDAVLYVTSSLNISALVIKPGETLNLYCAAASASLSGNNTANSDGTADAFIFWGLPTCTSISFSGNASFTGAIYAPNADLVLNGGGNDTVDFVGASVTATARLNGHFNFHYDEALATIGPSRGWIVTSWNELPPSSVPAPSSVMPSY
ncbi:MAG TPA: collagen-binding domain-containing protein, partial [Methylomirabilota bacterium]|nr:collagen-binding domain-containing protein [Methylomirabilota bacterium]